MKKIILLLLVSTKMVLAQLPDTQIFMLDIARQNNKTTFSNPILVSNKIGYNNQPFFTPDDKYILFTSNNGKDNTNIYKYDLHKHKIHKVTKTNEAEYSPRLTPDGETISCVRVEKDTVTQHFYGYNTKGKKGHLLSQKMTQLGYYTWYNAVEMIGLILPEPFALIKYSTINEKIDTLAIAPGRTFQVFRNNVFYVDESDSNHFAIREVSKENMRAKKNTSRNENPLLVALPQGSQDFIIMNDGTFLISNDGKILAFNPKKAKGKADEKQWIEIANLKKMGIEKFYRMAISDDNTKLAVVKQL